MVPTAWSVVVLVAILLQLTCKSATFIFFLSLFFFHFDLFGFQLLEFDFN